MSDQVSIALIAALWAAGVGVVGLGIGWLVRRRSLGWLPLLVAVVAVAAVVAAVIGTSRAMFLSAHDFRVALLGTSVAGLVALAFAAGVGGFVVHWSAALHREARRFGDSGEFVAAPGGPAEFTALATELARTSDRLRDSRERERRLESARRELVSWVSHDLRTPLAGLRAMTEALEDGLVEDTDRYHRQMRAEVDRMVGMADDLFELSRIHAGVLPLAVETVPLRDLVGESLAGAEPVARAKGVRLDGDVDADLWLRADPAGLSRVVANLLMNAIRHTPAEGAVAVEGRPVGGAVSEMVELAVSDGCGGIPEEDLDRVFDVAWRGATARTPDAPAGPVAGVGAGTGSGAGLGLAIVKGIVEAHHGSVRVANAAGGCRFVVRLPVDAAAE